MNQSSLSRKGIETYRYWAEVYLNRARSRYRTLKLNALHGVRVIAPQYIGKSVRVTTDSDGWNLAGSVTIACRGRLSDYSIIDSYGGTISIGPEFFLGRYSLLQGYGDITIGRDVMIGPHASIIASSHIFEDVRRPMRNQGVVRENIVISDNVWIGAGARILGGVNILAGAIVAAGAVVTSDVGNNEIVAGIPAKVLSVRR